MSGSRRARRNRAFGELLFGLVFIAALVGLRLWDPEPMIRLRHGQFDMMQRFFPREVAEPSAVFVGIDEASIRELGQWPWPRSVLAEVVTRLKDAGAAAIGFDILFSEADRTSVVGSDQDQIFASAMGSARVVVGESGSPEPDLSGASKPRGVPFAAKGGDPRPFLVAYPSVISSLDLFEDAAKGIGFLTLSPEQDGVIRRVPLLSRHEDSLMASLSLEILRVVLGQSNYLIEVGPGGVERVRMGALNIPTDRNARVWPYYKRFANSDVISVLDVLHETADPRRLKDRVVIVGAAAAGLGDIRAIPEGIFVPGPWVQAQTIDSIVKGELLQRPYWANFVELLVFGTFALLLWFLTPRVAAGWTVTLLVVSIASLLAISVFAFLEFRLLIDIAFAIVASTLCFLLFQHLAHRQSAIERAQIRGAFGRYLSPDLVEQLANDPDKLKLGGENRELTLMFSDIRGFTALSERFADDPQALTRLINRFLTPMTDAILEEGGTVDKYMGDCIMAFWNAPLDQPDHARRACRAALAMHEKLAELNAELAKESPDPSDPLVIRIGIGLATGTCVVGNMGSDKRFDFSALGDTVNLASRLEGQTANYFVPTIVSEITAREAGGMATLELDRIAVKGKNLPVTIFALLGDEEAARAGEFGALVEAHGGFLQDYRGLEFDKVGQCITELSAKYPHLGGLYGVFRERADQLALDPPDEPWDAVFRATSK